MLTPSKFADRPLLHISIISLLGLIAYSNTFNAPFTFDDLFNIVDNPLIRDISNIPSMFEGYSGPWASRPLLNASMALNYHFGGLDTTGYHIVNVTLHIINGLLLYMLVVMTGKHLGFERNALQAIALMSSAMFVVHPIQTEAVTYIVSRSILLATAFYLLGIILFLKATTSVNRRVLYIAGLLIVSLMGMGSREDFATFPAMLFIYDMFFVSQFRLKNTLRHWKAYVPVILSLGYFAHLVINNTYSRAFYDPTKDISRAEYAITQLNVQWTYLRLLFLPVNQNLDYDYPISKTLFGFPAIFSLLGYLSLWAGGIMLARKKPLVAFAVLWFLVALLPVSFGVVLMKSLRLDDVIFEHRLYLPGVAFFPLVASGLYYARKKFEAKGRERLVVSISVTLVLVLATSAFTRNSAWRSDISVWEDVVRKSPSKARGYNNLGIAYKSAGLTDKAVDSFLASLRLEPEDASAHNNLGVIYFERGQTDKAIDHYMQALRLNPGNAGAHNNLGIAYRKKGLYDKAIEHHETAIWLKPGYAEAYNNLANAYLSKDMIDRAIELFQTAIRLAPDYAGAHNNIGNAYLYKGNVDDAIKHLEIAVRLNNNSADVHFNLGAAYKKKGLLDMARGEFESALRLNPADLEARQFLEQIENQ